MFGLIGWVAWLELNMGCSTMVDWFACDLRCWSDVLTYYLGLVGVFEPIGWVDSR